MEEKAQTEKLAMCHTLYHKSLNIQFSRGTFWAGLTYYLGQKKLLFSGYCQQSLKYKKCGIQDFTIEIIIQRLSQFFSKTLTVL